MTSTLKEVRQNKHRVTGKALVAIVTVVGKEDPVKFKMVVWVIIIP